MTDENGIRLAERDIRIDVYRSGRGHPCLDAIHLPTGIRVRNDDTPSYFLNKRALLAELGALVRASGWGEKP